MLYALHAGGGTMAQFDVPELGGAFVSIAVGCLDDVSPEELAATPIHYGDGRNNAWWQPPAITSYL